MCTSGRWRWWRGHALTSTSLWTCMARAVVSCVKKFGKAVSTLLYIFLAKYLWKKISLYFEVSETDVPILRQDCCDHRRCHRRGRGASWGIRAPRAGVCLDFVSMWLIKLVERHDLTFLVCILLHQWWWLFSGVIVQDIWEATTGGGETNPLMTSTRKQTN